MKYSFEITCGQCGGDLEHMAEFRWSAGERKAVARCVSCEIQWSINVEMTVVPQANGRYEGEVKRKLRNRAEGQRLLRERTAS